LNPKRHAISARLLRLPGDLLLALINGTAILVIIAAVLALIAITRLNNFAGHTASTMTEAVLSKIDLPSRDVLANLQDLRAEIRTLGDKLGEIRHGESPVLQAEIIQLERRLESFRTSIDRLSNARTVLITQAFDRLGQRVGETLVRMRAAGPPGLASTPATDPR
jgi:hypothetical protein